MKKTASLAAALAVCAVTVFAEEQFMYAPPRATVIKMEQAPVIDGIISEAERKSSAGMFGFVRVSAGNRLLFPADARFNVGTDGRVLYISAECETGPDGILSRARKGRAGRAACRDDSFEFVFIPNPREPAPSIYHIIVNNKGGYMSTARKGAEAMAWEPSFTSSGQVKDGIWTYEAAFPLSNFGLNELQDGQEIGLRICRNWKRTVKSFGGDSGTQSSWSQIPASFFSADGIGLVGFRDSAPVVRFLSLTKEGKPDMKVSLRNPSDREMTLSIRYQNKPSNSQSVDWKGEVRLKPGETRIEKLTMPQVTEQETVETNFEVAGADGKDVFYRRAFRWSPEKPKIFAAASAGTSDLVSLKFAYYPSTDQMFLRIDAGGLKAPAGLGKLTAVVKDGTGREIARIGLSPLDREAISETLWKLPSLKEITKKENPSGEYLLTVTSDGAQGVKLERKFQRKVFEWEGNSLGMSDPILPRFTPIQIKGQVVSTVLRDHTMNRLGFFEQIRADGQELLKEGGIRLEAVVNGKPVTVTGGKLAVKRLNDAHAEASGSWQAGPLSADFTCRWDYDGVMTHVLTLKPFEGMLDSLKMIIPLDAASAYLFHPVTDGLRIHYGGKTPDVWNSRKAARQDIPNDFVHYIWLGTEGAGLSVFAENDKNWSTSGKVPAQELYHRNGTAYLVYNIVSKPLSIRDPREITLGFLATPVKPMAPQWRLCNGGWNVPAGVRKYMKYTKTFLGSNLCQGGVTASDDLFPRDKDLTIWKTYAEIRKTGKIPKGFLEEWMKGYRTDNPNRYRREIRYGLNCMKGKNIMFYTNGRGMRTDIPEAMTFMDDWFREEFQAQRDRQPGYGASKSYSVEPVASFRDFALHWYHIMLGMGVTDHLYWDDMFLAANVDRTGRDGAYKMEDGRFQPSVGLWNMRELVRRAAALQLEMGKTPNNMVHMTNAAIAPILSYAQQDLDWEDNLGINPFQQRYTREYIRTLSIGRQFGNLPVALGLVTRGADKEAVRRCLRSGAGVCLTHEITWTSANSRDDYWTVKSDLIKFGYGQEGVPVRNYWEKDYPVVISGETSSILVQGKNEIRLVVCNYGETGTYTAKLDLKALGLTGPLTVTNGETNKPVASENAKITFPLEKYSFIYLIVKGR